MKVKLNPNLNLRLVLFFATRGGPCMNLYIDYNSFEYNSDGEIKCSDDLSDLLRCRNCNCSLDDCPGANNGDPYEKLGVLLCATWRPKYELIY